MNLTHRIARVALVITGVLGALAAPPARAAGDAEARSHLAQERRSIEATHARQQRQCADQFVVTSCQEAARAQRREALLALAAREAALDDAERRERARERQARIDAKVARQAASAPDREPYPLVPADEAERVRTPLAPHGASRAPVPRPSPRSPEEIEAREAESRSRFDQRTREARERQEAAAARQAEKARAGKPAAAPLPALGSSGTQAR